MRLLIRARMSTPKGVAQYYQEGELTTEAQCFVGPVKCGQLRDYHDWANEAWLNSIVLNEQYKVR